MSWEEKKKEIKEEKGTRSKTYLTRRDESQLSRTTAAYMEEIYCSAVFTHTPSLNNSPVLLGKGGLLKWGSASLSYNPAETLLLPLADVRRSPLSPSQALLSAAMAEPQ